MNEFERFRLATNGEDEGCMRVVGGTAHLGVVNSQPGAGVPIGYDDLRAIEAAR
jgi:hypothetical protein